MLSFVTQEADAGKNKSDEEISIQDVPSDFALITEEEMEAEAKQVFDSLVVFHGSPHISRCRVEPSPFLRNCRSHLKLMFHFVLA